MIAILVVFSYSYLYYLFDLSLVSTLCLYLGEWFWVPDAGMSPPPELDKNWWNFKILFLLYSSGMTNQKCSRSRIHFHFLNIFFYSLFICIFFSMLSWTFLSFFSTVLNFLSFLQSPLLTSTQPCILHSFVYRGLKTQTDLSPCNLRVSIGEFSRNFHIIILALQPPVRNQDIIAICHDAIH